jgi:GNAT domain-containint protein/N-acyltransferase family protein
VHAPREPLALPGIDHAPATLSRLGLDEIDRAAMLAARPSPTGTPYLWWRLERAYRQLVTRIGTLDGRLRWADPPTPYLYPWAMVAALPHTRAYHRALGVPDDVSWATLGDLGRQLALGRRVRGRPGILFAGWLTPHFRGLLYQLGRLQYQRFSYEDQPVLDLHIPATGPLNPDAVDGSLNAARAFFARHFPDTTYRYAHCNSWLLDPQLAGYLPAHANIVAFQRRFTLLPVPDERPDDDLAVLEFVFLRERKPLQDNELGTLPQRTALQRAIVTHLAAGRHWYFRPGWFQL